MEIRRILVVLTLTTLAVLSVGVSDANATHEGCNGALSAPSRGPQPFLVQTIVSISGCKGRVYSSEAFVEMYRGGLPWRSSPIYRGNPGMNVTALFDCETGTTHYQAKGTYTLWGATGSVTYGIRSLTRTISCWNQLKGLTPFMPVYDDTGTGVWIALPH